MNTDYGVDVVKFIETNNSNTIQEANPFQQSNFSIGAKGLTRQHYKLGEIIANEIKCIKG